MKKRLFATIMAAAIAVTALSGCGGSGGDDGKLTIKLGYLPQQETQPEQYEIYMGYFEKYESEHPNIDLVQDLTSLEADQIMANAAAGQLPNLYRVPFTDASLMIKAGYAKDITDIMKKRGYDTALNDDLLNLVKDDEGKLYGIPYNGYMMGMWYNVNLFEQAGLMNDDGTLKYPKTFDELITTAQTITEKTGAAGFGFPTMDAECGWVFMNIAWNYGVKFMEQNDDGSYTATFDSPEMINAFQYIHDLKWKYKTLPDNNLIDRSELQKLFATDRCAMSIIGEDWINGPVTSYNMDKNKIATSAMPAGPAGRYAETGGDVWLLSKETTDEQAEAIFDWLELLGYSPSLSDIAKENITNDIQAKAAENEIIVTPSFSVWKSPERKAEVDALYEPHINVDQKLQQGLMADDVQLHAEEPAQTQQLYRMLSSVIQEILTNENVDIPSLVSQTQKTFQADFLDKN